MAGCIELKLEAIGQNRLEVAAFRRQLRASTRAAPSEPLCCVHRFGSMRAPFPADAGPPSREEDLSVPIPSFFFSILLSSCRYLCGHFSDGHNIELSRPADQSTASPVHQGHSPTYIRHSRGRLQRFVRTTPLSFSLTRQHAEVVCPLVFLLP